MTQTFRDGTLAYPKSTIGTTPGQVQVRLNDQVRLGENFPDESVFCERFYLLWTIVKGKLHKHEE